MTIADERPLYSAGKSALTQCLEHHPQQHVAHKRVKLNDNTASNGNILLRLDFPAHHVSGHVLQTHVNQQNVRFICGIRIHIQSIGSGIRFQANRTFGR